MFKKIYQLLAGDESSQSEEFKGNDLNHKFFLTREFYKESYIYELERKHYLDSRLSFPLAIISLMSSLLIFYFWNLPTINVGILFMLFMECLAGVVICLGMVTYFFIRAIYNYDYAYLPVPEAIEQKIIPVAMFHAKNSMKEAVIDDRVDEYLKHSYSICISKNTKLNDIKSMYYHKFNSAMIGGVIFMFLSAILYISQERPERIEKFQIVQESRINGGK